MKLVEIYTAPGEMIANVLKGVLEEEDIRVVIRPGETGGAFRGRFGGAIPPYDPWALLVPEQSEERAREILTHHEQKAD